jgi:hypothetical protein
MMDLYDMTYVDNGIWVSYTACIKYLSPDITENAPGPALLTSEGVIPLDLRDRKRYF